MGKSIGHGVAEKGEADELTFTADSWKRSVDSKDLTCLGQGGNWSRNGENKIRGGRQIRNGVIGFQKLIIEGDKNHGWWRYFLICFSI